MAGTAAKEWPEQLSVQNLSGSSTIVGVKRPQVIATIRVVFHARVVERDKKSA